LRWKVVFFVLAKESFALTETEDDPARGFPPLFACAAFSRAAWSFWAFGPSPRIFSSPALGMKSLIGKSSHGARFSNKAGLASSFLMHRYRMTTKQATAKADSSASLRNDTHKSGFLLPSVLF
jgi:hypothetical protein